MLINDFTLIGRDKQICQDATFSYKGEAFWVIAVADGIGTHEFSQEGSHKILELLKGSLESEKFSVSLGENPKVISEKVDALYSNSILLWKDWVDGIENKRVDTTFSLTFGYEDYIFFRSIGDSILIFVSGDRFELIQSSENVRSVDGATPSLLGTSAYSYDKVNFYVPHRKAIILSTDGMEDIIISDEFNKRIRIIHEWFVEMFSIYMLDGDERKLRQTMNQEFIGQKGITKGDDVGLAYTIFETM